MRGVAVAGVMLMHFVGALHGESGVARVFIKLSTYGVWGVDLFFVLSGFLITGILHDGKASDRYFRNFYARRTLRIFPLYYAVLLILFVLIPEGVLIAIDPELLVARRAQGWVWSYLTNIYLAREGSFAIPYVSHFWSLAVEEHFYLFWPFLVRFLSRKSLMQLSVGLGLFAFALRVALLSAGMNQLTAFALTPCRLDALCMGAWFALCMREPDAAARLKQAPRWITVTSVVIFASSLWHATVGKGDDFVLPLRGYLLSLLFGLVIFVVTPEGGPRRWKALLRAGWLRTLGKYSYGLYVFHGILAYGMHRHETEAKLTVFLRSHAAAEVAQVTLGLGASMLIAVVSYELFESRLLKLKQWFE